MPTPKPLSSVIDFLSPVSTIDGLGPKRVTALRENGIETIGDLLYHFPRRYIDRSDVVPLSAIEGKTGAGCSVTGTIEKVRLERGRRSRLRALLSDGSGSIELLWFSGIPIYRNMIKPGVRLLATGRIGKYGHFQMVHPLIERLPDDGSDPGLPALPCYPASEAMRVAGLGNRAISKAVQWALCHMSRFPQVLPSSIEKKKKFPPLADCLRELHLPKVISGLEPFRARLRYEELYRLALSLRWSRRKFALPGRSMTPDALPDRFRRTLPFTLTPEQDRAIEVLYGDAASPRRMHRLLQGDVGSGKTLVAFFATFPALASGLQVAWLAPTEVLAMQTYRLVVAWLDPLGFKTDLLKGDMAAPEKKAALKNLSSGKTRFIVGTHALLQPSVKFKKCGMMVIDEQHKFGAQQRLALQEKDVSSDFLLMSATPIPQTLAKTLYGDLEIVSITGGPAGRLPVATYLVPENKRNDMERFVEREIEVRGARVYCVVPRIERDDAQDDSSETLKDVETVCNAVKQGPLSRVSVACLHGLMSSDEKERVMASFAQGSVKLLVSTTVIEVGIDVPEATIIIVENAERFGMAQLHQLRGRVGRGKAKSYCFLLTTPSADSATLERLNYFCHHRDGFEIAEMDLTLRGPGEVAGFRQTGWDDLKMADMIRDAGLFREIEKEIDRFLPKP
jgi:ATP-dependent DNA helicase RecG